MGSVRRNRGERSISTTDSGRMAKPILLLLAVAVVLSVFLPALEAASVRRRSRNSRRASVRSFRTRNNKLRRGRQEEEELGGYDYADASEIVEEEVPADYDLAADASEIVEEEVDADYDLAADASEIVEDEVAAEASDAVEASDIPTWCDPSQNLAAFLLFPKLKCWCVDNGYGPEFGPYGSGCPADDVDNALDAGASETVEEEVSLEDVLADEGVDYDYVDDIEAAVAEARRRRGRSQKRGRSQRKIKNQRKARNQRKGRNQKQSKT